MQYKEYFETFLQKYFDSYFVSTIWIFLLTPKLLRPGLECVSICNCIGVFADTTIAPTSHALFLREYWDLPFCPTYCHDLHLILSIIFLIWHFLIIIREVLINSWCINNTLQVHSHFRLLSDKILEANENIATGETSQAITPFHFFDNFNFHR